MSKQLEAIDNLYPKSDKLQGKEVDYLLRSATLICSAYAYHRKVLPHTAFKMVRICDVKNNPVFDSSHKKAHQHRNAIQSISKAVEAKMIRHLLFGLCDKNDPENVVEALRFQFDYHHTAMNIVLPNATNVRVSTKWDFGEDLNEVLKRVRAVSGLLAALPAGVKSFLMVQYNKRPDELPKDFDYHDDYDVHRLTTLPLARFPCDTYNTTMIVEIRSKFFEVAVDDIRKDVERALKAEDEDDSDSDSTPPPKDDDNDGDDDDDDDGDDDDIQVIEDSLEKSKKSRRDPTPADSDGESEKARRERSASLDGEESEKARREHSASLHSEESEKARREHSVSLHSEESEKARREHSASLHSEESEKARREHSASLHSEESEKARREHSASLDAEESEKARRKRTLSPEYIALRMEPEPKKLCLLTCYNYKPLNKIEIFPGNN